MSPQYFYVGGSWALKSFDPPGSPADQNPTSLAKQWQIPHVDLSEGGTTVLSRVEAVEKYKNVHGELPIVWIYNEPISNLYEITGLTLSDAVRRSDWRTIWEECNYYCLDRINKIGLPVLLIGGSTDVIDCKHSNITVGYHSWQKYLAEQAGLAVNENTIHVKMDDGGDYFLDLCWAAESVHRFIHENPKITPSKEVSNAVWDIFFFWETLAKADLFFRVHPNYRATEMFAKLLLPTVTQFLDNVK